MDGKMNSQRIKHSKKFTYILDKKITLTFSANQINKSAINID